MIAWNLLSKRMVRFSFLAYGAAVINRYIVFSLGDLRSVFAPSTTAERITVTPIIMIFGKLLTG